MSFVIVLLPLISFICCVQFGWLLGRKGSAYLATGLLFLTLSSLSFFFIQTSYLQRLCFMTFGSWIYSDVLTVDWGLYYDNLIITMLIVVTLVSAVVHLYSIDYMAQDPHLPRFMSYLSLFTFFMFLLVVGNNIIILFLGWEGVGLCSYLLISFWYTRLQANKSAIKALIINRIADLALTIGMVAIFFVFKSFDFHTIFALVPFIVSSQFIFLGYEIPILSIICFLLFIGAMGKSAQIGLHTWLPDAMEGPTPVSALIHAATMVTAGVFLIIKCSPLFEYVPSILSLIIFVGATTAFFSATVGLFQNDIKKVIAYSTCSQLGYMIFACGLSNYHVGLFHLINHAFFKALLFLSAGAIIHSLSNEQDLRKYGGLILLLPFTSTMFLIGTFALIGLPFLTGFYSKDLILELALTKYSFEGSFAYSLGLITAFLTSFYSFRLFYMAFLYQNNSFKRIMTHIHELPIKMAIALTVLSLGSIFFGYLAKDLLVGLGTNFWNESILILPAHNNQLEAEFFGLIDSSFFPQNSSILYHNTTYQMGLIKLLPFSFSILACLLVSELFRTHKRYHNDGFMNLMPPYFMDMCLYHPWLIPHDPRWHRYSFPQEVRPILLDFQTVLRKKNYSLWDVERHTLYIKTALQSDDPYLIFRRSLRTLPNYYDYFISQRQWLPFIKHDNKTGLRRIYKFFIGKWYFDLIYNELLNRPLLKWAYEKIFSLQDKGMLELFGPFGLSFLSFQLAFELKKIQLGRVYYYAYFMLMFLFLSLLSLNYLS